MHYLALKFSPMLENFLRLSKKAGKLKIGTLQVLSSIRKSSIIIIARDYAQKDKIIKIANRLNKKVLEIDLTKEELGMILNRNEVGVVSIIDKNLSKLFLTKKEVRI